LSDSDLCKIRSILQQFDWKNNPVTISYKNALAMVDKPSSSSIDVIADSNSQTELMALWNKVDALVKAAGISTLSRTKQYPFHNTIAGMISYQSFPVDTAIAAVNAIIKQWTNPIGVAEQPQIRFCGTWDPNTGP